MPISEAIIRMTRYPPELIPDSWFGNLLANAEASPPVLEIKKVSPYLLRLTNIQLTANANVAVRATYDGVRIDQNTAAMISALVGAWDLPAKDMLRYNLFGLAPVANYTTHFGVWSLAPTIAHKLLFGIPLTNNEKAIAEELDITSSVEKGVLPLPIAQQIQREYHVLGEETHTASVNIALAATPYSIEVLTAKAGECIVLTRIAAAPGGAANLVRFIVDRDNDAGYADLFTFPLSLVAGGEVACFIPAMKEIRLTTQAAVAPGAHLFRYTFQRIKLTNTLKVRFGLIREDELPEKAKDVWKKVWGGVL